MKRFPLWKKVEDEKVLKDMQILINCVYKIIIKVNGGAN